MWAEGKQKRRGKEGPLDSWLYSKEVMGGVSFTGKHPQCCLFLREKQLSVFWCEVPLKQPVVRSLGAVDTWMWRAPGDGGVGRGTWHDAQGRCVWEGKRSEAQSCMAPVDYGHCRLGRARMGEFPERTVSARAQETWRSRETRPANQSRS